MLVMPSVEQTRCFDASEAATDKSNWAPFGDVSADDADRCFGVVFGKRRSS